MTEPLIFDAWTPMSFKRALGSRKQPGVSWLAPTWVGDHARRLQAYKMLQAYYDNAAREYLGADKESDREQHREYGDAALLVEQILAALIGDDQHVVTDGADLVDRLPDDAEPQEVQDAERAAAFQEWLEEWATDERLGLKLIETERNAVNLGDGVYSLGWSGAKGRPRLRVWDPGFYYPVLDDGNEDDYPSKVHIAWEMTDQEDADFQAGRVRVRRITWEVRELPDGATRRYPWNSKPSSLTCYMSDGIWSFERSGKQTVEDFTEASVRWMPYESSDGVVREWRDIDLGIDFVPVVHEPNSVAVINHYGRSAIASVLQILDDIANIDTDLSASASTTGKPPVALSGGRLQGESKPTYRAGEVWELGEGGRLDILDTSRSLDALLKLLAQLLDRLSINSRVPASVLGRITGEAESGIHLALMFGPLRSLVNQMRLVRDEKYPLILKFAHRIALANGQEDVPPEYIPSRVEFGSYLPSDVTAAVEMVTKLLAQKAISVETAVQILMLAGLPIDDAQREVERIQSRDFEGASALLDATGDEAAVFDYLGREQPPVAVRPAPPTPPLPQPPPEGVPPEAVPPQV